MASSGQPLRLGPFLNGLNTGSDPTAIADAELAICQNMELDIDGSLISRPPFKEMVGPGGVTERFITLCDAIFSGVHYLIVSNSNGVFYYSGGAWGTVTTTIQCYCAVQYANFVYLVARPGSASPGGKWDGAVFTAVAAIPKGQACVIHKERLFITPGIIATSNASRLSFSDPGNFDSWPGTNFLDVSQGDGSNLLDLTVYQDNLLLFKNHSSYVLAYDTRPTDAVLRKISSTIGVPGQYCVANYENQIYVIHNGWVYEIINYDFNRLNTKVPFVRDTTAPTAFAAESTFLALLGDRLVCRFLRKIYVYGLRTRTWSEWSSAENVLQYFGPIVTSKLDTGPEYYSGSSLLANVTLIKLSDAINSTDVETVLDPTITITDTFSTVVSNGWSTADTGQIWQTGGPAASDYSKDGTKGLMSLGSVNVSRDMVLPNSTNNTDLFITFEVPIIAVGASIVRTVGVRMNQVSGDRYFVLLDFKTTGSLEISMYKLISNVGTAIGGPIVVGAYVANQQFTVRLQANGTTIRTKCWATSATQPLAWAITATDATITTAGATSLSSYLGLGNTNGLPVVVKWDNLQIGDMADVTRDIACNVKTKNFDMAISHQFKRLWWWGADVSTNRDIKGIATPIVFSFNVTWGQLAAFTWGQLNTWGQPLTASASVETVLATGTGTARRFAKFLKSLRYRQINFEVRLLTKGSTADGPARLFTMMVITESKQVVPKGVN